MRFENALDPAYLCSSRSALRPAGAASPGMASNGREPDRGAAGSVHPAIERAGGMSGNERQFFDTRRAADYLGLSHRTLDGYRVSGAGPAFHRFGNRVRYRRLDLDDWAAKRRATTTAEADRLSYT